MSTTRSRLATVILVGCLAAILVAFGAAAGNRVHSKVKIKDVEPEAVSGVVKSTVRACQAKRNVKLFYGPVLARRGPAPEFLLGKTKTNRKGKWKLEGSFTVGHYRAAVPEKNLKGKSQRAKLDDVLVEVEEDEEADDEPLDRRGGRLCSETSYSTDHG